MNSSSSISTKRPVFILVACLLLVCYCVGTYASHGYFIPPSREKRERVSKEHDHPVVDDISLPSYQPPSNTLLFTRPVATNSPSCGGVQPNRSDVAPLTQCKRFGFNNNFHALSNRWYCVLRDGLHMNTDDRTCQKRGGNADPYRFSTILHVDYEKAKRDLKKSASLCWGDWGRRESACNVDDIPQFYGTPDWWVARSMIDFHPIYYRVADDMLRRAFGVASDQPIPPFITVHLRRGDYVGHCKYLMSFNSDAWKTFKGMPSLRKGLLGCYPGWDEIVSTLHDLRRTTNISRIFIATDANQEAVWEVLNTRVEGIFLIDQPAFDFSRYESDMLLDGSKGPSIVNRRVIYQAKYAHKFRFIDRVIVEMCIMIRGKHFLFNKYSSMSATVYEQARVNGNIAANDGNVITW